MLKYELRPSRDTYPQSQHRRCEIHGDSLCPDLSVAGARAARYDLIVKQHSDSIYLAEDLIMSWALHWEHCRSLSFTRAQVRYRQPFSPQTSLAGKRHGKYSDA